MRESLKIVAGMALLSGCADGPPEFARPVDQESYELIKEDLDRAESETPFVKRLLDRADPLPDTKGEVGENNDHLKELLDELHADGYWYLENDRFLFAEAGDVDQTDLTEMAPGIETKKEITDNYVVITLPEGYAFNEVERQTGTYMHEFSRFYYPYDHILATDERLSQLDEVMGELSRRLYGIDGYVTKLDVIQRYELDVLDIQEYAESERADDPEMQETLEEEVLDLYDEMQEWEDLSDQEWKERRMEQIWSGYIEGNVQELSAFGITESEYREALLESDALFNVDRERLTELQQELREAFPEYNYERLREQRGEVRSEMDAQRGMGEGSMGFRR